MGRSLRSVLGLVAISPLLTPLTLAVGPAHEVPLLEATFNPGSIDPASGEWRMKPIGKSRSRLDFSKGMLRYLPDRGSGGWHGMELRRELKLYADYTISLQVAWDARGAAGACRLFVEPKSGRKAELYAIFHLSKRAVEIKDTAQCVGYLGDLPESGRGTLRFERRGRELRAFWQEKRLAAIDDLTPEVIDSLVVSFRNLSQTNQGAWVGLAGLKVTVPEPDVPLLDEPIPGRPAERKKLAEGMKQLQAMLQALTEREYKRETTLEVMGFDLANVRDQAKRADLAQEARAFDSRSQKIRELRAPILKLAARAGGTLQFFDRVPAEDPKALEEEIAEVERRLAKTFAQLDAREAELRQKLAAFRPKLQETWKDNRDWARNNFHIYWFNHYGNVPPGWKDSVRYMSEMGATGLQEWGYRGERRHGKWEDYAAGMLAKLDALKAEGMRAFLAGNRTFTIHPHPNYRALVRENLEKHFQAFGSHPAFGGVEFDEIHFGYCWCRICMPVFHEYLRNRFSREELIEMGLIQDKMTEVDRIGRPGKNERTESPPLYTVRLEWRAHVFEDAVKAAFDRAHELRPDALMHTLLSPANFAFTHHKWGGPWGAPLYRMAALSDVITIDPYWNGVPDEAYFCDLMRAHARGPALLTVGMSYGKRTPDSIERDLSIPFAHTDGMYVFDWAFCFKQPPYKKPQWKYLWLPEGKWDKVWSVAMKAKKIEPYLVRTESPRSFALLHSMRSQALELHKGDLAGSDPGKPALSLLHLYNMRQLGLYNLFRQARLQPDPVYAEGLTAEMLGRYKVLYVQNAVSLTPEEEDLIRSWVREGGHLIATASTSILDRWGRTQKDYGLADVFGAAYVETRTLDKVSLKGEVEYSGACDVVRPASAETVAFWPDGSPAVLTHAFGKGSCVLVTARDLGLCYTSETRGAERSCFNVYKTYTAGVVNFVRGLVLEALRAAGQRPPFEVHNCPAEVEVSVRVQQTQAGPRRIVHLLNYGFRTPVRGVRVALPAAPGKEVSVFYPVDGQEVSSRSAKGDVEFTIRDFNVHEAVVVEER